MPDQGVFDFEFGDLNTGGTSLWDSWGEGSSLAPDWEYQAVSPPGGFDQFGVPQLGEGYTGFQQFIPDDLAFSGQEGYGQYGDFTYSNYSSEYDPLSGLSQDELAYQMGLLGFEHLLADNDDDPTTPTPFELMSDQYSMEDLAEIFTSEYGDLFGEYNSTGIDMQGDISEAQAEGYYSSFQEWEEGAISELELSLDQLGQNYLTDGWNQNREYLESLRSMNTSEANYLSSQVGSTRAMSRQGGRSGLSGGSLGKASERLREGITSQFANLKSQKARASQSYSDSIDAADEMYQMQAGNMVSGFQSSQSTQAAELQNQIEGLESQFELTVGQSIGDWYNALINQVANLDIMGPDISVFLDDDTSEDFNWSPFGLDIVTPGDDEEEGDG